jgi:hypothetical protein
MAAVVKIANFVNKHKDDEGIRDYIGSLGNEWTSFVEGELKRSNDTNNRSICG